MLALAMGIAAALAWAVHDLLVRKLSQGAAVVPMILAVLAAGSLWLAVPALMADWRGVSGAGLRAAALSGAAYAAGALGLYMAFKLAPVRLVAPVVGAYPMLSLGLAALQGRPVAGVEWAAVAVIVAGIAFVALTGREESTTPDNKALPALGWAVLGAFGFAATFAFGQEAARLMGDLPAILISRLITLGLILALAVLMRQPLMPPVAQRTTLVGMGLLDATAVSLVLAAGGVPHPEYAAVAAALFGVLTILLAWRFLAEPVRAVQWLGIATVFAGIAVLSFQGAAT
jgi:drug/metabolite transporter (DMT)-like permease